MYQCPNCAGNLRFDPTSQNLHCSHCNTSMDPYSFQKDRDAEENELFEVTIFTCPQCGGEIISEDLTAATFCSYCGSATILDSRISKERRPKHIIPFKTTMDDCKNSYQRLLKRAVYAPDELKNIHHIEKFRGIYMPYWIYSLEKKGLAIFKGHREENKNGYKVTGHYRVEYNVDTRYDGLAYDASSTFRDNLSEGIAPFNIKEMKPFTPSFLSGFYADTNDIAADNYRELADDVIRTDIHRVLEDHKEYHVYNHDEYVEKQSLRDIFGSEAVSSDLAMLPVWFLSYRNKDRIAYAVVNGQTGKASADLPIDFKKYMIFSLITAIPITLLLNLTTTLVPGTLLKWAVILMGIGTLIINQLTNHILERETITDAELMKKQRQQRKKFKKALFEIPLYAIVIALQVPGLIVLAFMFLKWMITDHPTSLFCLVTISFFTALFIQLKKRQTPQKGHKADPLYYDNVWKQKLCLLLKPAVTSLVALVILLANPASDLIFYSASILCMGIMIWMIGDIVKSYNILCTRRPPQLNRRGGDEVA